MSISAHNEGLPDILPIPDVAVRPDHEEHALHTLLSIEKQIFTKAAEVEIEPATMTAAQKPAFSKIIGSVLVAHLEKLAKNENTVENAGLSGSNTSVKPRKLPGLYERQVDKVYAVTGADRVNKDSIKSRMSWDYLNKFAKVALSRVYTYPEILLADSLQQRWFDNEQYMAEESAYSLLAAYGLTVHEINAVNAYHAKLQRDTKAAKETVLQHQLRMRGK